MFPLCPFSGVYLLIVELPILFPAIPAYGSAVTNSKNLYGDSFPYCDHAQQNKLLIYISRSNNRNLSKPSDTLLNALTIIWWTQNLNCKNLVL